VSCKPKQDGTCCDNEQPDKPVSALALFGLADVVSTLADSVRLLHPNNRMAGLYDELAAFLLRCGCYAEEWDVDLADLKPTAGGPDTQPARTTDARWLAAQADLYASQHGRRESEVASMLRAASFLCAARGASLEDLQVVVERFGEGKP
jgi:hypothetical protein